MNAWIVLSNRSNTTDKELNELICTNPFNGTAEAEFMEMAKQWKDVKMVMTSLPPHGLKVQDTIKQQKQGGALGTKPVTPTDASTTKTGVSTVPNDTQEQE